MYGKQPTRSRSADILLPANLTLRGRMGRNFGPTAFRMLQLFNMS